MGELLLIAGDLGGGSDIWLGFLGMLQRASARSAARFNTISYKTIMFIKDLLDKAVSLATDSYFFPSYSFLPLVYIYYVFRLTSITIAK